MQAKSLQGRQWLWMVVAATFFLIVLSSCVGTGQQSDSPLESVAKSTAKPEQAWFPDPVPAKPGRPGASSITKIVVPSIKRKPRAIYRRNGPRLNVSMPDFEKPVTGAGGAKKSVLAPGPVDTEKFVVGDPQPLSWVGTDIQFLSTDFDDNGTYNDGFRFIPPDPHAAAGPNHLVNVVNTTITFHQKNGTIDFQDSLANFFSALSPLTFTFDPKVLFDQYENRWVVITMEQTETPDDPSDTSRMFVAVSDDSDPNGTWYFSEFDSAVDISGNGYWADYPGFGVDAQAVYIATNLFGFGSGAWGGVRLWIMDKGVGTGGFYDSGGTLVVSEVDPYIDEFGVPLSCCEVTTQISHMIGTPPAGLGVFLVGYSGINNGSSQFIQIMTLEDSLTTPVFTQSYVSLGNIDNLNASLPDMPQSGTTSRIESNDRRTLDAVWRDNFLWLTTTINPNSGVDRNEATALWVKIDTSSLASLSLTDSGTIGGEDIAAGAYTTFPSIAVNAAEDVVVGFSASASSIFAGAYFVGRQATDPAGFMDDAVTVKAGVDQYFRTFGGLRNRWGDYSATAVDPVDGCFWVYNEWADTRGTPISGEDGRWGSAYAKTCNTPLVCSGSYTIPAAKWTRFALPCSVSPGTVADVFSGLNAGDYNTTWVVYERDASTPAYNLLASTDQLGVGTGYWIYTTTATLVDIIGSFAAINDIDLVGVNSSGRDNYIGHNQNVSVDWNQVQVVDGNKVFNYPDYDKLKNGAYDCDFDPVKKGCRMSRKMHKWNGSAYQVFDGITAGSEGTLDPFDAFWVQAFKANIQLRIPDGTLAATAGPARASSSVESAYTVKGKKSKKPKKPKNTSWYIRLIAASGDMRDPGNVLGQMDDATEGNDAHDLEEPWPFGGQYLSILFTNPLFEEVDWGFTTDFRAPTKLPQGVWPFVVRAHASIDKVTISWEGTDDLFDDTWLVDELNGVMIRAEAGKSYTFEITGGEHYLRFEVGNDGG